jgi:hypothetical protein
MDRRCDFVATPFVFAATYSSNLEIDRTGAVIWLARIFLSASRRINWPRDASGYKPSQLASLKDFSTCLDIIRISITSISARTYSQHI